jgi:hypothetical protein
LFLDHFLRPTVPKIDFSIMSNAALVFAALCAKAADVAVADNISEVSSRVPVKEAAFPLLPTGAVAAVYAKSRDIRVADDESQTRSCADDKLSSRSNHLNATETLVQSHNDCSRHSRISFAHSSNDVDCTNTAEAAQGRLTLQRYLSGPASYACYDQPTSSRHSRHTALQSREDSAMVAGHYYCRQSRRSLIDDSQDEESVQMDANDFLEMAKQMVIAPSGGADQCHDVPVATITRFKSTSSCDMSTTSSISDPDSRRDSVEDLVSSLDSDNLIEALCKKAQTDTALARKLSLAAKRLTPRVGNEAHEEDAVDDVIARLFSRLAAVNVGTNETGSRGSRKSAQNKNKSTDLRAKSPQRSPALGKRRKQRKGVKAQRQNGGEPESETRSGGDDFSPKTATLPVLDGSSLISALAPHEIPSDEALLKIGWFKAVDATTGRYYFYTEDRSNVSWGNPLISASQGRTTVPSNDLDDLFSEDPFTDDGIDDADDCFQVVYARNESGRNILAR